MLPHRSEKVVSASGHLDHELSQDGLDMGRSLCIYEGFRAKGVWGAALMRPAMSVLSV